MNNIYNFLNTVWKEIQLENKQNISFIPFLLLISTLPLAMGVNNVLLGIFLLTAILSFVRKKQYFSIFLLPLIVFFLWICLSYFWSIDSDKTSLNIPKELPFLLVPLAFMCIPKFTKEQNNKILSFYSYSMVIYVLYFIIRAIVRYSINKNIDVFFYHGPDNLTDTGLVPRLLNAIHFSAYLVIAFFYFFTKTNKAKLDYVFSTLLFVFIILLSSKNIILIFILLILIHIFFYSKAANRLRLRNLTLIFILFGFIISFKNIKERFLIEFTSNTKKSLSHNVNVNNKNGVNNISIYEAWNNKVFTHNDFFPGTSFRVYQVRIFMDFLKEEPIFLKGFGFEASSEKLLEKEKQYNLYPGYGNLNFHNQYIQNFAELGIIGFILLLIIVTINIKIALRSKDFIHIAFAIVMISLFLTESFLWRQRGVLFFVLFYCLLNTKNYALIYKKVR